MICIRLPACLSCILFFSFTPLWAAKPNLLIVTVDDMSCDSVGVFDCKLPGTTPTIDQLAASGLRYQYAHVQTGSCNPSRNVMFSGRYSHNTGVEGFYEVPDADYPHLVDLMQAGGYFVGIYHKVSHSTPYAPYGWDVDLTTIDGERPHVKDPQSYFVTTQRGIELARESGKPFCLNINISDPHKPFYAMGGGGAVVDDPHVPSLIFTPEQVPIPGFLFDHPDVRLELAHYYSSVRRADDCLAQILKALDQSGERQNTVILFLSDHGMPLPFAKTAVWHHSTHTPWIVVWPGVTKPGAVDRTHMISAVDMLPTLLEIAGIDAPSGMDGRSFLPTLRGQAQPGRDVVYKFHNENSGRNRSPMRSVETKQYGYIFSPWSDGQRVFKTATTGTLSFRALQRLAPQDPHLAERLDLFQHGTLEQLYDYQQDPDALHNLAGDPQYAQVLDEMRGTMRAIMVASNDPLLEAFDRREDAAYLSQYVDQVQAESDARAKRPKNARPARNQANAARRSTQQLLELELPSQVTPGQPVEVTITHRLSDELATQKAHVTLKAANGQRIERVVMEVKGRGKTKVALPLPQDYAESTVTIAAFVGEDYNSNLQHINSKPIPVRERQDP